MSLDFSKRSYRKILERIIPIAKHIGIVSIPHYLIRGCSFWNNNYDAFSL